MIRSIIAQIALMFWSDNTKKIEFDIDDLNGIERYKDKEGNFVSDKINDIVIEEDLCYTQKMIYY